MPGIHINVGPDRIWFNVLHGREQSTAAWAKDDPTVGRRRRIRALLNRDAHVCRWLSSPQEPTWTLCSPNSPTNSSSKTSPNPAPFSALFPITISKPPTITSSNSSPWNSLIGAHENSDWSDGKLVIDANHGPIHLLQSAFYAVKLEVQRRDAAQSV
ncbi:MAG: hypothetical protein ABJF23_31535 [Bryobacteraceae bacterium]